MGVTNQVLCRSKEQSNPGKPELQRGPVSKIVERERETREGGEREGEQRNKSVVLASSTNSKKGEEV